VIILHACAPPDQGTSTADWIRYSGIMLSVIGAVAVAPAALWRPLHGLDMLVKRLYEGPPVQLIRHVRATAGAASAALAAMGATGGSGYEQRLAQLEPRSVSSMTRSASTRR